MFMCTYIHFPFLLFLAGKGFPEFVVLNDFNEGSLEFLAGDKVVKLGSDSEGTR